MSSSTARGCPYWDSPKGPDRRFAQVLSSRGAASRRAFGAAAPLEHPIELEASTQIARRRLRSCTAPTCDVELAMSAVSIRQGQPKPRAGEVHQGHVVARGLLVASGDGAEALEVVKEDLDDVALAVELAIEWASSG